MSVFTSFSPKICLRITSIVKSNGTFVNNEVSSNDKSLKLFGIFCPFFYMSNELVGILNSAFGRTER